MLLDVRDISKTFRTEGRDTTLFDGVSFRLNPGETLALTGESGAGKSTLLHMVAGLEPCSSGEILIDGASLGSMDDRRLSNLRLRKIGLVFQQFNLIPSLNVRSNVAFQARLGGQQDGDRIDSLIERLGLSEHALKYPEQLSGGQQQRVAIGRALAHRPALLLADEPTGNLDEETSATVLDLMLELGSESGAGLLVVTHSADIAARLGGRLHLSKGRLLPWDP